MTDRRAFLTAALIAPVAIAAPAMAAPSSDIPAMIAEYWRLWAEYERHPVHHMFLTDPGYKRIEQDGDRAHGETEAMLMRILQTPSQSGRDVGLKLEMVMKGYQDCELPEDLLAIIAKDAHRLGERGQA